MLGALQHPCAHLRKLREADDIVATLTRRGTEAGYKGSHPLRRPRHLPARHRRRHPALPGHHRPLKGIQRMDPAAVEKKTKVPPHMYPDLAALTGEQADNLPAYGGRLASPPNGSANIGSLDAVIENSDKIRRREGPSTTRKHRQRSTQPSPQPARQRPRPERHPRRRNSPPDLDALNTFFDEVGSAPSASVPPTPLGPIVRAAGSAGSASSATRSRGEGAIRRRPPGPVYAPIATSAPTKTQTQQHSAAFCAAAAEENYGTDEQGAPSPYPSASEGAVTLYRSPTCP